MTMATEGNDGRELEGEVLPLDGHGLSELEAESAKGGCGPSNPNHGKLCACCCCEGLCPPNTVNDNSKIEIDDLAAGGCNVCRRRVERGGYKHYNRDRQESAKVVDREFADLIRRDDQHFFWRLVNAEDYMKAKRHWLNWNGPLRNAIGACDAALGILGRATHSRQDFFAHAIKRCELDKGEGWWVVWTAKEGPYPTVESRVNVEPSSYPGEHNRVADPWIRRGSLSEMMTPEEHGKRKEAAINDTNTYLAEKLARWWLACAALYRPEDLRSQGER
jgi:hypothetical protein